MSSFLLRLVGPVALFGLLAAAGEVRADAPAKGGDAIVGDWLTANGEAKVHFGHEGSSYVGRVIWLKTSTKNGQPITDEKNPDPAQRSRPMIGAAIVWGMQFDGSNGYANGHCYDPTSGKTYAGKATLDDANHLALRGYVGIPLFGRSETWTRQN